MKKKVGFIKPFLTMIRSWSGFVTALFLLGLFWYFCYWLIARYASSHISYFKWGAISAIVLGVLMIIFNEPLVVVSMGCKRVRKRADCPELWDAVEEVKPFLWRPRIYLCKSQGMNAFAFGWGIPYFSAVAATKGIISELSNEELEAVMAHEMGHIRNKDILVSTAMTISIMIMAMTGWMLLRLGPYSSRGRRSSSDSKGKGALAILVVILVGALLYIFGRILGVILQMFVSRQREYAADAQSARKMGTSRPLITALQKISGHASIGSRTSNAAFGFLCTADPDPSDLMSTHPSLTKRVAALENLES